MSLNIIALGLAKRTKEGVVELAVTIHDKTKDVADFTTANPTPAQLKAKHEAVTTKLAVIGGLEADLTAAYLSLTPLVDDLELGLNQYANHAESKTKDKAVLTGWGFPVRADRQPVGPLPAPVDLRVSGGDLSGTIEPHWDPVSGATAYIVEVGETSDGPWTQKYVGTKSSCVVSGLVSGKEYWVRVCAVGAAGNSNWSDRAAKRAT